MSPVFSNPACWAHASACCLDRTIELVGQEPRIPGFGFDNREVGVTGGVVLVEEGFVAEGVRVCDGRFVGVPVVGDIVPGSDGVDTPPLEVNV